MALIKPLYHILQTQSLVLQQDRQVVEQIGGFVDKFLPILGHGGQRHFDTLFTHLLGDALGALGIEAGGVAGGRIRALACCQDLLELGQEAKGRHGVAVEAGGIAQMAGGADGVGGDQQGVLIAVGGDGDQLEHMARALPLGPEALFAAAEEGDLAGRQGFIQGIPGHESLHQHLATGGMLDDGGDHAVTFRPVQALSQRYVVVYSLIIHGWRLLRFSASVSVREWG